MKRKKILLNILATLIWSIIQVSFVSAGSISGTIIYDGKVPKLRPIKMGADPICLLNHSDEKVFPQVLVLGDNKKKTMGNVFVHITKGFPKKDYIVPKDPAILNQKGCMYNPHVLGIMVGQKIKVLNPDGTLHNVHGIPKNNREFNVAMPKFRKEMTRVFNKAEFMFPFKCDVHPWMLAWISVMDHPYFYTTKSDGEYKIDDLPAGNYEISIWHEKLGEQKKVVILENDTDTKIIDFTMARPERK